MLALLDRLRPWSVIGYLSSENIESRSFTDEELLANLNKFTAKQRELAAQEDQYQVDCFRVSAAPFKAQVNDELKKAVDGLGQSLRSSIARDIEKVEAFESDSFKKLHTKPQTKEQMLQATSQYHEIKKKRGEIHQLLCDAAAKNKILRNKFGKQYDMTQAEQKWDQLELEIADYDKTLSEQSLKIKEDISHRSDTCNLEISKFYKRCKAQNQDLAQDLTKESAKKLIFQIQEWRKEWVAIEGTAQQIQKDCEHLGIPVPQFESMSRIKQEFMGSDQEWNLSQQFAEELAQYEQEYWMVIRSRLLDFFEMVNRWGDQFGKISQSKANSPVIGYML